MGVRYPLLTVQTFSRNLVFFSLLCDIGLEYFPYGLELHPDQLGIGLTHCWEFSQVKLLIEIKE